MNQSSKQLSRRVLVIDDNVDAGDALVEILSITGHIAVAACDGPTGIALAATFNPEVIFLDIGMPGMSGFDTAAALRKIPSSQNSLIVALTGWNDEETRRKSYAAGFDVHVTKPIPFEVVEELVLLA